LKAVILSAGFGKRLAPITNKIPKPLVNVLNISLLEYTLYLLKQFKIKEVFINVFHLAECFYKIDNFSKMKINILKEPFIKGTLGGILNFKDALESEDDFLVINADILFYIDIDKLISNHIAKKNIATLVLKKNTDKHTPVFVDDFDKVAAIGGINNVLKEYSFCGIQVLNKDFFSFVKETRNTSCIVKDFYVPFLNEKKYLNSYLLKNTEFWYELGNINQYDICNIEVLKKLYTEDNFFYDSFIRDVLFYKYNIKEEIAGILTHKNTFIDRDVLIKPPVFISKEVRIENKSVIGPNLIIDENIVIPEESVLENKYIKNI